MSTLQLYITMGAVILGTMITRFLPFLLFPVGKPTPKIILYLGKALPAAALGLLVVYCFKDLSLTTAPFGIPELISIGLLTLLHLWKRNLLLSIGAGTVCYMLLVQFIF